MLDEQCKFAFHQHSHSKFILSSRPYWPLRFGLALPIFPVRHSARCRLGAHPPHPMEELDLMAFTAPWVGFPIRPQCNDPSLSYSNSGHTHCPGFGADVGVESRRILCLDRAICL